MEDEREGWRVRATERGERERGIEGERVRGREIERGIEGEGEREKEGERESEMFQDYGCY